MKFQVVLVILTAVVSLNSYGKTKRVESNNLENALGKNNQTKELKGELLITASEERAIKQLQKLLSKHSGTSVEAGLWFRLAELYLRRSKTARFFEMNRDTDSIVSFAPTRVTKMSSRKYISDGIGIYEKIQKKFPYFRDMDLVLFNNAFARQQIGENEKAKSVYKDLLHTYPESLLVPDTNLALGEMLYDERKYAQSLEYFNAIRKYPNALVYPYGLYKAGWAYYNIQNTSQGLKNLEEVVAFGKNRSDADGEHKLDLRKEALSDMVLFFSELYPSTKAVSYFSQHATKDEIGVVLLKLATMYGHHSKYPDLEIVLNNFIDKYPLAKERSKAHFELINTYETLKQRGQVVSEMRRLNDICQSKASWFQTHMPTIQKDQESIYDCQKLLANSSSTLATKWHKAWTKNKNDENTGDAAEAAYEIYLSVVTSGEKHVKALYSHADLLFLRQKFRPASEKYYQVANLSQDKKTLHDAPYSALVSLEKAVDKKWNDQDEKRFTELAQLYLKHNPKGQYATEVRFQMGFIAYEKGRLEEAGAIFQVLASVTPVDGKVIKAQDLYLDILNTKKDFTNLKILSMEWSKKASDERKIKLTKIYQQSYFSEIQKTEESGNLQVATLAYKNFTEENPNSPLADKAFWNALQLDYKIGDLASAAESGHKFYKKFPKSDKAKESLMKAAQGFEFLGQLKRAADVLDDLAVLDSAAAEKWINIASDFRFLEKDFTKARTGYVRLVNSKDEAISTNAVLKMITIEKQSNGKSLSKYEQLAKDRRYEPFCGDKTLEWLNALYNKGSYKSAFESAMDVLRDKKNTPKTLAGARYIQARVLDKEFKDQSIITTPERLTFLLKVKTEKLEKAQSAYREVIRYADAEHIVKALRDLALCYDHYVKAVRNIHFTKPLPKEEMDMLQAELEKVTVPMEDKAVETVSQAINHAKKFEVRDGTIAQLQNILNGLNLKPNITQAEVSPPARVVPLLIGGES